MRRQPKGGMCATCEHAFRNCSNLPFELMPAIDKTDEAIIVRCTEFVRKGILLTQTRLNSSSHK